MNRGKTLSKVLSPKAVENLTSLSGMTIWRLRQRGEFPEPIPLSKGRVGYLEVQVDDWIASRSSSARQLVDVASQGVFSPTVLEPSNEQTGGAGNDV